MKAVPRISHLHKQLWKEASTSSPPPVEKSTLGMGSVARLKVLRTKQGSVRAGHKGGEKEDTL